MSKIQEIRELNGISKIDMCKMLHMSEASYSKKECNIEDMKFGDIIKICNFLNCSIDDIYSCNEDIDASKLKALYINKNNIEFKSYIYFLKDINRGIIKIGKTSNLYYRISQIRSSMLMAGVDVKGLKLIGIYPTIYQDVDLVERELHLKFKDKRCIGEWFKINDDEIGLKKINKILGISIFTGEMNCEIDINRDWFKDIEKVHNIKDLHTLEKFKIKSINLKDIDRDIFKIINLL